MYSEKLKKEKLFLAMKKSILETKGVTIRCRVKICLKNVFRQLQRNTNKKVIDKFLKCSFSLFFLIKKTNGDKLIIFY